MLGFILNSLLEGVIFDPILGAQMGDSFFRVRVRLG